MLALGLTVQALRRSREAARELRAVIVRVREVVRIEHQGSQRFRVSADAGVHRSALSALTPHEPLSLKPRVHLARWSGQREQNWSTEIDHSDETPTVSRSARSAACGAQLHVPANGPLDDTQGSILDAVSAMLARANTSSFVRLQASKPQLV
jgi:hypothetical protein